MSHIRNPVLRQITAWAINPGSDLPWQSNIGDSDITHSYRSYVREFGDHFQSVARTTVKKIMAGTAGNVPAWGYKLLARFPKESLAVLIPALSDQDLKMEEAQGRGSGIHGSSSYHGETAGNCGPRRSSKHNNVC